jgi:uncharacterized membrane protein
VTHVKTHPRVRHPFENFSDRVGDKVNGIFGSMKTFWILVFWQIGWMALAIGDVPLFKKDPYPFTFLLFLSNLIQLWALPVLGNTQNRADVKRDAKANTDHEALSYIACTVDHIKTIVEKEFGGQQE